MKVKLFTIPIYDGEAMTEELNRFLASHRVVTVDREFVANGTYSIWAICVTVEGENTSKSKKMARERIDYREVLSPEDFALYSKLRAQRKELADKDGLPAYALFTNEQLAAMATERIMSLSALGELSGVGAARVEKYGEIFLEIIRRQSNDKLQEPNPMTTNEAKRPTP